jgi:GT2 family glycosyltransferase
MSFRREILARLGGLRDDFVGAELREDTDIFLRVRALGARAVFAPDAVVDHLGAPHAKGRRFDYRYQFSARYNHVLLLARNFGLASSQLRAWVTAALRHPAGGADGPPASPLRLLVRGAMGVTAVLAGLASAMRKARWKPLDPARNDRAGVELRARLSDAEASS